MPARIAIEIRLRRRAAALGCLLAFVACTSQALADEAFFLPLEQANAFSQAVNNDGIAVGGFGMSPTRWIDGAIEYLPTYFESMSAHAYGLSADGSIIAGWNNVVQGGPRAWRLVNGNLLQLPGSPAWALDLSNDGTVIVGAGGGNQFQPTHARRWINGVASNLGDLPGGDATAIAYGVSGDGSVIVGHSSSANGTEAFRHASGVMTGVGDLPGGAFDSRAYDISDDGQTIVGRGSSASGSEAFRWRDGVFHGLGDLPGGAFSSEATAVSADGAIIVGSSSSQAFIWQESTGMRALKSVLTELDVDTTGWTLERATGISPDGRWITGWGHAGGELRSWSACIPEPGAFSAFAVGLATAACFDSSRRRARIHSMMIQK